jgi:hypothetical protein
LGPSSFSGPSDAGDTDAAVEGSLGLAEHLIFKGASDLLNVAGVSQDERLRVEIDLAQVPSCSSIRSAIV